MDIGELVRDPAWQFLCGTTGVIATILGIIVAYFIYQLQRERKEIAYEVQTQSALIRIVDDGTTSQDDLEIRFRGEDVVGIFYYIVRITNTGNRPITPQDYISPIRVHVTGSRHVLNVNVLDSQPEQVGLDIEEHLKGQSLADTIEFPKLLLNPHDWVTFHIVVDQEKLGVVSVDARIVGVSRVQKMVIKRYEFVYDLSVVGPFPIPLKISIPIRTKQK